MAAGDLTASEPIEANTKFEIQTQINTLNLAAATDQLFVIRDINRGKGTYLIFKVERAAA